MKGRDAMRFAVKHAVAAGIVLMGSIAVSAASYFALLTWAVLADQPLGGPLAFPFLLLLAAGASLAAIVVALFPVTALTEWKCRGRNLRIVWQIPIAIAVMGTWALLLAAIASVSRASLASTATVAGVVFLLLLVPLGIYWWSLQCADWILGVANRERWFIDRTPSWLASYRAKNNARRASSV